MKKPRILQEWWRTPPSNLEKTLRWPRFVKELGKVLFTRIIVKLIIIAFVLGIVFIESYTVNNVIILILLSFIIVLIYEFLFSLNWWKNKVLPNHLENIKAIREIRKNSDLKSAREIVKDIEKSMSFPLKLNV